MSKKINIATLVLLMCLVLLLPIMSFSHGVLFEFEPKDEYIVNINLKWSDPKETRGIFPLYFQLEKAKILTIGYEIKDTPNPNQFLEFDLRKSIPPIRVVLRDTDPSAKPIFNDFMGTYAEEYIMNLHDAGIVNGMPDGSFRPYDALTRAEFMVMLCKVLGIKESEGESDFKDINSHWSKGIMKAAFEYGLIKGYRDNTLKPDKVITIAEACVLIDKSFKFKTSSEGYYQKLRRGKWFSESVKKIFDVGILGVEDRLYRDFDEDSPLNRADISMIVSRAMTTM